MSKSLIIIGAGLTGLYIGLAHRKKHPEVPVTILEKASYPGGLLSSFNYNGHWVDKGTFFFNNEFTPNLLSLFPEALSDVKSNKHLVNNEDCQQ